MQTNGSSVTNGALMYTEANTNWEIVSVGNYNGDNKAELLWWNQQTGQVYLMQMNGLSLSGAALLYTEPDTTWHIQGETEWRITCMAGELLRRRSNFSQERTGRK